MFLYLTTLLAIKGGLIACFEAYIKLLSFNFHALSTIAQRGLHMTRVVHKKYFYKNTENFDFSESLHFGFYTLTEIEDNFFA